MPLVFRYDHEEDGVKYLAGNVCPRGFPHHRKRELVASGTLVDIEREPVGVGAEVIVTRADSVPPLLTTAELLKDAD